MDHKKLPDYIKALRDQRLQLKKLEALTISNMEVLQWINGHATSEVIVAETDSVMGSISDTESILLDLLNSNQKLIDEFKKPPQSIINMMKGRPRAVQQEEYEEIG